MANAFARGRPIESLVVTAGERAYLERQVQAGSRRGQGLLSLPN
jgi:hypothetical protein